MALNFPDSPTIGDEFTGGGFTWVWTGSTWSKVVAAVGGSNDFALLVGNTGNTTYILDRTYTSGRYTIDFVNDDTTYDIYFIAENGTYAGYTNGTVAEVSADFTEVVVIGAANNETILFNYDGTLTSPSSAGDVPVAGAFLTATSESSLPDIDDFTVLTGGNFATDVAVAFIGQDEVAVAAKSVVRSSSTELLATRPDAFPVAQSPYSVRVLNPGIPAPTGSNAHILSNAINAGTNPVWVTDGNLLYNVGAATPDITLVATDTEGSDIDYSVVSGTIPAGLTLNGETGVISGTFSGSANEGDSNSVTFRATDAGGNFLDKAFNFVANTAPTWTTTAGAIDSSPPEGEYSFQLVATTGTVGGSLSFTLQAGSLPSGLSLSSSGLISGTSSNTIGATFTFTVRVADSLGLFADREFSILIEEPIFAVTLTTFQSPFANNSHVGLATGTSTYKWVLGQNQGSSAAYGTDLETWSTISPNAGFFGETMSSRPDVCTYALSLPYYGGPASQDARYTVDGVNFSRTNSIPGISTSVNAFYGVAVDPNKFFAYWGNYTWYTSDLNNWNRMNHSATAYGPATTDGIPNGRIMVKSLNGLNIWTNYSGLPTEYIDGNTYNRVAGGNGILVASSDTGTFVVSTSGTTLTQYTGPTQGESIRVLGFANGKFILLDNLKRVFSSTDGVNWQQFGLANVAVSADDITYNPQTGDFALHNVGAGTTYYKTTFAGAI